MNNIVAPYAGAWIEIFGSRSVSCLMTVAPYAGAWIEIFGEHCNRCGHIVAPYAGAWIEIFDDTGNAERLVGRSLRGSVD